MQTGKNAMASAKEAVGNIAASAKSGMDKTKATAQEKLEKVQAHDPVEKEMAEERKEQKIREAEVIKQQTREQNAAEKAAVLAGGFAGHPVGTGSGLTIQQHGHVAGGTTAAAGSAPAHNSRLGHVRPVGHSDCSGPY